MTLGEARHSVQQVGEYLVAAELARRGWLTTTFAGNVKDFDIIAVKGKRTILVQVKTMDKGQVWHFDAKKYLNIYPNAKKEIQEVKGIRRLDRNVLVVLVKLRQNNKGKDQFYKLPIGKLQRIIRDHYRDYLNKKKGHRPKNWRSTHCGIGQSEVKTFYCWN